jgi:hypothetical protein
MVLDAGRRWELLFVVDDWAEEHHDIELVDGAGRRLAKARLLAWPTSTTGRWLLASSAAELSVGSSSA